MANDMLDPDDLAHLPGAPFTEGAVDAAVAAVRAAAGWHISPVREETFTLDVTCGDSWLRLPTGKLVNLIDVRDTDTDAVLPASGYRVSYKLAQVKRSGYWPAGYGRVEVDVEHGYEQVPPELLAVIAEAAFTAARDQTVKQQAAGVYSVSLGNGGMESRGNPIGTGAILNRFRLRYFPGIA